MAVCCGSCRARVKSAKYLFTFTPSGVSCRNSNLELIGGPTRARRGASASGAHAALRARPREAVGKPQGINSSTRHTRAAIAVPAPW